MTKAEIFLWAGILLFVCSVTFIAMGLSSIGAVTAFISFGELMLVGFLYPETRMAGKEKLTEDGRKTMVLEYRTDIESCLRIDLRPYVVGGSLRIKEGR